MHDIARQHPVFHSHRGDLSPIPYQRVLLPPIMTPPLRIVKQNPGGTPLTTIYYSSPVFVLENDIVHALDLNAEQR